MTAVNVHRPEARLSGPPRGLAEELLTWEALAELLSRFKWLLLAAFVIGGAIPLAKVLRTPRTYTASARFILNQGSSPSAAAGGLMSQLGLASAQGGLNSPSFYVQLIKSREVLWPVANKPLARPAPGDSAAAASAVAQPGGRVLDFFGVQSSDPLLTKENAVDVLRNVIIPTVGGDGVVEVKVRTTDPVVSRSIAQFVIAELNKFNLEVRQQRGATEREFIERRLRDVQDELRAAENALKRFLEQNRRYEASPKLTFSHQRLSSEVAMRQQLFTAAVMAYENAKVEEIRDTPLLTVIEAPDVPARPDPRSMVRRVATGAVVATSLALFLAIALDFRARLRRHRAAMAAAVR